MEDCVFCKIAQHKEPAHIVWEDDDMMAFLDINPISDGHTLVVPKKGIHDIGDLDEKTGASIMNLAKRLAEVLKKNFGYDGVSLMNSNGIFQDVPHFHFHVFGRNKNNDIEIKCPSGVDETPEHLTINAEKIRAHLL